MQRVGLIRFGLKMSHLKWVANKLSQSGRGLTSNCIFFTCKLKIKKMNERILIVKNNEILKNKSSKNKYILKFAQFKVQ